MQVYPWKDVILGIDLSLWFLCILTLELCMRGPAAEMISRAFYKTKSALPPHGAFLLKP